jgi:hypothetical protein
MPKNPMLRHQLTNSGADLPKPLGKVKSPVKAERVQRSPMPKFGKKTAKQKGRIG